MNLTKNKNRFAVFALVLACLITNVVLSVKISSDGLVLSNLESEIEETKQTEKQLKYELISESSLQKIQKYAESKDFVRPDNIVYIKDGLTGLASLPQQ